MDFKKVILTFNMDTLFDTAKLRSANIANHIISQAGTSMENKLALTDSERNLWDVMIRYPFNKVYSYLMNTCKIQEGTYEYNITENGSKVTRFTIYLHTDWDTNLTRGLNDIIERSIVSGGLSDWYRSSMQMDAFQLLKDEHDTSLREAAANINRRKFVTRRPHVTF